MTRRLICDIETDGLLDELTKVHSLVFKDITTGEVESYTPDLIEQGVIRLAEADELIFHNGIGFDIPALKKLYPWFEFPEENVTDTLVLSRLIFPKDVLLEKDFRLKRVPKKLKGSHSLEAWGYRMKLLKGDYGEQDNAWDQWTPEMQAYCEQDVEVTEAVYHRLMQEADEVLADGKVAFGQQCRDLEHQVAWILERQKRHGFYFDVDKAEELAQTLVTRRAELMDELQAVFKPMYLPKGQLFYPKRDNKRMGYVQDAPVQKIELTPFNPGSRAHCHRWLSKLHGWEPKDFTETGQPKVDETILNDLPWPEAKLLAEYFMVGKRLGQIAEGDHAWLKHYNPKTHRIHGSVNGNGAVTGRMTHSFPNIAQVPSNGAPYGEACRACFSVPKGFKQVGCDADGLELRDLAGYMAPFDGGEYVKTVLEGDKEKGTDTHSVNCRALGLDPKLKYPINGQEKKGRDIAKTWFYGFIYGAGDFKLGTIKGKAGKAAVTQGKKDRKAFLENLPALKKLTERVKAKAQNQGFIRGLDGRKLTIRHPHASLNTLLQSAGAIQMKQALVILDGSLASTLTPGIEYEFVANVHDEWQMEVMDVNGLPEWVLDRAQQAIRLAGDHFNFKCPLDASGTVGDNWSQTH
jgi:DNA polymerase I-like protein with 3'-5' exonuclease and polymerase domains